MKVQYAIQADVFDISQTDSPGTDCFLVDSNVWLWMTYSNAGHGEPGWRTALMAQYAAFVQCVIAGGAKVCCCGLSLAELSHIIEKTEREIHELSSGSPIRAKEYRHNFAAQRNHVVTEIQAAWAQVSSLAEPLTITIDNPTTAAALNRLQT